MIERITDVPRTRVLQDLVIAGYVRARRPPGSRRRTFSESDAKLTIAEAAHLEAIARRFAPKDGEGNPKRRDADRDDDEAIPSDCMRPEQGEDKLKPKPRRASNMPLPTPAQSDEERAQDVVATLKAQNFPGMVARTIESVIAKNIARL
jgi:hypothetical protein